MGFQWDSDGIQHGPVKIRIFHGSGRLSGYDGIKTHQLDPIWAWKLDNFIASFFCCKCIKRWTLNPPKPGIGGIQGFSVAQNWGFIHF